MKLNEYQKLVGADGSYFKSNPEGCALHFAEECGEVVKEIRKLKTHACGPNATRIVQGKIKEEFGDVLFFVAEHAAGFGWTLEEIASGSIEKIYERYPERKPKEGDA